MQLCCRCCALCKQKSSRLKQHVMQVLRFARDLALDDLHIEEVGCLGDL